MAPRVVLTDCGPPETASHRHAVLADVAPEDDERGTGMGKVGIVDATAASGFEFAADRAGRTAKAFNNRSGGALIGAHDHDDCALLGGQMFVDFRHGGTLQERCCNDFLRTPSIGRSPSCVGYLSAGSASQR